MQMYSEGAKLMNLESFPSDHAARHTQRMLGFTRAVHSRRLPENLRVPADSILPQPTVADLRALKQDGWYTFGTVSAIINDSNEILMLVHRASTKNPAGALGPLAETARVRQTDGSWQVERTIDTLHRSLQEELGLVNVAELELTTRPDRAWELQAWPVGDSYTGEFALAVCPVVYIRNATAAALERELHSAETMSAVFMPTQAILEADNVRPGTHEWLATITAHDLIEHGTAQVCPVPFDDPGGYELGWQDIRLQELLI